MYGGGEEYCAYIKSVTRAVRNSCARSMAGVASCSDALHIQRWADPCRGSRADIRHSATVYVCVLGEGEDSEPVIYLL